MEVHPTTSGDSVRAHFASSPLIWAIEAFPEQDDIYLRTASALRQMFPDTPILPVYVLSEESFTARGFSTFLKPALKPMAEKAIESLLSQTHGLEFEHPRILHETSASRPACAKKLLRFAEKIHAGRIALGSHARHGLSRFFVGSFSEAILDQSRIPVLVAGPHADLDHQATKVVVYATDFSDTCRHAYDEILRLCASFHADLHLFHKPIPSLEATAPSGIGFFGNAWVPIMDLNGGWFDETLAEQSEFAAEWSRHAEEYGVKVTFAGQNSREPTAQAIVEYVRGLDPTTSLIAMVSQTGPIAGAILGSVTRDVIRSSPVPVYVAPRTH